MEALVTIGRGLGYVLVVACLLVVAIKVLWNVGLPYAMIAERRRGVRRGWTVFPGVELVPLLVAIGSSAAVSATGWLGPWTIMVVGTLAVVGSYLHLAFISGCYSVVLKLRSMRGH
jgi:hypothetical protein